MQRLLVTVSIVIFIVKIIAWYLTSSVSILSDALESTVNVAAGFIGLFSIILSAKPKDTDHPYGHGKIEFISAAIEGTLIFVSGIVIIYNAIQHLVNPPALSKLDTGLILIGITAALNYTVGYLCVRRGRHEGSPVLVASGTHLKTDTYTSLGIIAGIGLVIITGYPWIDSIAGLVFAILIMYTGYKIIRKAVSGIMDESDREIITEIIDVLNRNRLKTWIDAHNMRVINYAGFYHIDCHMTVPYYYSVNEAHDVLDSLTDILKLHFRERIEFFIHMDGCIFEQCGICHVENCPVRKMPPVKTITWDFDNVTSNRKHVYQDISLNKGHDSLV